MISPSQVTSKEPHPIVQGTLADPGDWLIIEQPEIHLNPRLQAALADLLVDIVRRKVGVIVETHSEHLLLRLRRLLAEERVMDSDVGLYFVEQEAAVSRVRQVPVEGDGFIEPRNWPRGFFAETLEESMALAQAQARHRRRLVTRRDRQKVSSGDGE